MFVQGNSQNSVGPLTKLEEQKDGILHAPAEKQLAEKFKRRADGMFVPNGFDIETIAKINQEEGKKVKPFLQNRVNKEVKSFAENLEITNPSIGKDQRMNTLKNKFV